MFTKVTRAIITHWRNQRHKAIIFLDDGIAGHSSVEEAKTPSRTIRNDLERLGFSFSRRKVSLGAKVQ